MKQAFLEAVGPLFDPVAPLVLPSGRKAVVEAFEEDGTVLMRYRDGEKEQVTMTTRLLQRIILGEV